MVLVASFLTPAQENKKISTNGSSAIIGRHEKSDIQLDHPSVSREHAQLTLVEGKSHFTIVDLGSSNGTYIEGVQIKDRSTLYPGSATRNWSISIQSMSYA